ncbi:MAG: cytochrome c-type biogenesis protein CcmH [Acidimicrobiales bacterium]|jgi:cytochrome c-type biogenesis protein CcmH
MAIHGFKAQWRWLSWVLIAIIGVAALIVGAAGDSGPQSDGERMSQLASTIRCPQCRGQSVAESNVAIAREIRGDIRARISEGETDDEIRQVYIERYGRSIVLNPDSGGFTGLVWIVPVVAAGMATAAVALAFRRWRVQADSLHAATEEDRELVAELRRDRS